MTSVLALMGAASSGACVFCLARVVSDRLAHMRGRRQTLDLNGILADPAACFALLATVSAALSAVTAIWALPFCLVVSWALSRHMPVALERRRKADLRSACDGQLDVLCDIVAMGVRAGLSFDAALDVYCEKFDNELSREMRTALLGWENGMVSRERALRDLARRLDSRALKRFAETVVQAIRYGSPLADMLGTLAEDMRKERYDSIERQVAKAPVKMLVPTATCILPAMLILVMGPVLLQFMQTGI